MADTFFVGQTGDPLQVAAVSLTNPIFILFMAFSNMFGMGGSAAASIASCKLCCKIRRSQQRSYDRKHDQNHRKYCFRSSDDQWISNRYIFCINERINNRLKSGSCSLWKCTSCSARRTKWCDLWKGIDRYYFHSVIDCFMYQVQKKDISLRKIKK